MLRSILLAFSLAASLVFGATSEAGPPKVVLNPSGTGAGATGELKFKELVANGQNYTGFKAPDTLAGNPMYTLPPADGTNGYVLSTNGAGVLSWVVGGGGGGVSDGTYADITVSSSATVWTVVADAITNAKLADAAALSVKGNATNASANPTDIAAASDHQVMRRSGTALAFGALNLAQSAAVTGALTVANGGTGLATITAGALMTGNGTGNVALVGPGTTGQMPISTGTTIAMATIGTDATITSAGALTIANNAITTAKITDANVTYAKHSSAGIISLQRKNLVINPRFEVWHRAGTSFTAPANNTYTADRFKYYKSGLMVHDVSRSTDVPTVASAGVLANYSILVDCTTLDGSLAANEASSLRTVIEGYDFTHIAQRSFTVSFWVKATKTGIYCVGVANSVGDRGYAGEYTVNVTDTWEKKTVNIPASPSAGTWDYTNGVGLFVNFSLGGGTGNQITGGSWQTTTTNGFPITSNQVNACDSTSNNFRMTLLQIEPGDNATTFEFRPIQQETVLCERYYESSYPIGTVPGAVAVENRQYVLAYSTDNSAALCAFKTRKRATPTMLLYSYVGTANKISTTGAADVGTIVTSAATTERGFNGATDSGTGFTSGTIYMFHWTADADF